MEADGMPSVVGKAGTEDFRYLITNMGTGSSRLRGIFATDRYVLRWRRYKVDALKTLDARTRPIANHWAPFVSREPVFCRDVAFL